jgi:uncharacterized protein DUF222/HNH endonuclease
MHAPPEFTAILDEARALRLGEMSRDAVVDTVRVLLSLRNVVDHLAATATGRPELLDVAAGQGRTPRELLMALGCAPGVAARLVRIGTAAESLPTVMAHAADGAIPAEHVDAVVKGVVHISARSPEPVDEAERYRQQVDLLGQFFSGATPAQISDRARALGNQVAGERSGLPAAEDRSVNTVNYAKTSEGRLALRADLDAEVGAKLVAAMEELSAPRPEPDGTHDARPAERRRADALEAVLDIAARGSDAASAPRTQLLLTVPAEAPVDAELEFMGPVSLATLERMSCDATVTTVIVDSDRVPTDMGRDKRLFPPHLRTALYVRDRCCIKCGAPAGRTQAHHIKHFAHGGCTSLANGCLLCPACHADVHHNGWEVTIGLDKHPWLIPPPTVDPRRRPIPAYNRRTMRLDAAA